MGSITHAIGNVLGGSGNTGIGWSAGSAPIDTPVGNDAAKGSITSAQNAIAQQQAFLQALQAQGGIQNQTSALARMQGLEGQLGGGAQNEQNVFAQQQALANQLQGISEGRGPNPAQTMLSQATGQNVANQAALMAGQRGAGANAGLLARQIAQQGASTQQQAANQAAIMQAQQQLGALGQLGGQQQAMAQLAGNQIAQQQAQQANVANLATQQVGQQANATQLANQLAQNQQAALLNQINAQNNAKVGMQSNINNANAGMQQQIGQMQSNIISGVGGGVMGLLSKNKGGMISNHFAYGGVPSVAVTAGPQSALGQIMLNGITATNSPEIGTPGKSTYGANQTKESFQTGQQLGGALKKAFSKAPPGGKTEAPGAGLSGTKMTLEKAMDEGGEVKVSPISDPGTPGSAPASQPSPLENIVKLAPLIAMAGHKGGKVPAIVSPGEIYLNPREAKTVEQKGVNPEEIGHKIPGKAKIKGDSLKNDTVKATLEEGGVVIPRSVVNSGDIEKAKKFVEAVMARASKKK